MSQKRKFRQLEQKQRPNSKRRKDEQYFGEQDRLHFTPKDTFDRKVSSNEINSWKTFMYPQIQPLSYEQHQYYSNLTVDDIPISNSDSYQDVFFELTQWSNQHLKTLGWRSNQTKYYPVVLSNGKNELKETTVTMLKLAYKQRQIVDASLR